MTDNGIGFSPAEADRIFEIFARLDRAQSGSGIGLALSRDIARRHRGELTAAGTPGVGASFTLRLPRED